MRIDVVTLFADFFTTPLSTGLVGKALADERATVGFVDPRTFTKDRHRTVDDAPYGGGAGMVMKPEPVLAALHEAHARGGGPSIMLTPQGRPLTQQQLVEWSALGHLVLLAGRYEGFDERIRERVDFEVSIGDFVLTGGEYGALVIIDGVIRLLPGTVGNDASTEGDSFSDGLLEHPHYTRPELLGGASVPPVLLSGAHDKVAAWRRQAALLRTRARRPDLLERVGLDTEAQDILRQAPSSVPPIDLVIAEPVDQSALDGLVRLTAAYGLRRVSVVGPVDVEACRANLPGPHPVDRRGSKRRRKMAEARESARVRALDDALGRLVVVASLDALELNGPVIGLSSQPPDGGPWWSGRAMEAMTLWLGPADERVTAWMPAVRWTAPANDLGIVAAAGIALDRVISEG